MYYKNSNSKRNNRAIVNPTKRISINCSLQQYKKIQERSSVNKKSMNKYLLDSALDDNAINPVKKADIVQKLSNIQQIIGDLEFCTFSKEEQKSFDEIRKEANNLWKLLA